MEKLTQASLRLLACSVLIITFLFAVNACICPQYTNLNLTPILAKTGNAEAQLTRQIKKAGERESFHPV
jgi:hypothetical protein